MSRSQVLVNKKMTKCTMHKRYWLRRPLRYKRLNKKIKIKRQVSKTTSNSSLSILEPFNSFAHFPDALSFLSFFYVDAQKVHSMFKIKDFQASIRTTVVPRELLFRFD